VSALMTGCASGETRAVRDLSSPLPGGTKLLPPYDFDALKIFLSLDLQKNMLGYTPQNVHLLVLQSRA
jgi:hypothetical protein